jgi:predicted DNA-binding protein YlxM (UPF0122 family)
MFNPEDFELPLEKQLRIRVIDKEIYECTDIEALQENLKQCAASLMKYQHLLSVTLRKQIENDIEQWSDKIVKEVKVQLDGRSREEQD